MPAVPVKAVPPAAIRDDQIVTLSKLVLQSAFQPIAEASTGLVFGYEALMRGFDRLGLASPLALLDRAESCGQLLSLEHFLASRAIAGFSTMPGFSSRTLFMNFDARLIGMDAIDMIERLGAHLQRNGIPASSICFELSERFEHTKTPALSELCAQLQRNGFKLAIDDFGVGHSGLRLLCDQPVDYIKIDRHFIDGIDANARKRHLVRQTVMAAHMLGTRVIAEGVETEAAFLACRDLGCDLVQGYFVARPTTEIEQLPPAYGHLELAGRRHPESASLDAMLIRQQVENVPSIGEDASLDLVFDLFRRSPERSFFPVLNANGEPRGILHEHHLKDMIYHPFGRDLLKNHMYQRRISHFVEAAPIADLDMPAEDILRVFASAQGGNCIILTERMRYAGILSAPALLRIIHEKQLKSAQDQNPLTGLPGNRAIRDYVQQLVVDGDEARHVCYCDFDNFKPFNDVYGFQKGDMAITLFAALMRQHFIGGDTFIAHVGGDDFFIGLRGGGDADVSHRLTGLLSDFAGDVRQLYSAEHRAAGAITTCGRDGVDQAFPLMRCSIAVLAIPAGNVFGDAQPISLHMAGLKKKAKVSATGLVLEAIA